MDVGVARAAVSIRMGYYQTRIIIGEYVMSHENKQPTQSATDSCIGWDICRLYHNAIDTITDGIHIVDCNLHVIACNRVFTDWCRALDIDTNDIIGKHLFEVFGFLANDLRGQYQRVLEHAEQIESRNTIQVGEKQVVIQINRYPVIKDGTVTHVVSILHNTTDIEKLIEDATIFKTLADTAAYGIALISPDLRIVYTNQALVEMHGYNERSELEGHSIEIIHTPEQFEEYQKAVSEFFNGAGNVPVEIWRKRRDGSTFTTLTNSSIIYDVSGIPKFMAVTTVDISERIKHERALRQSEEKYRLLVENVNAAIGLFDRNGTIKFINSKGAAIFGDEIDALIGKNHHDYFPTELADERVQKIRDTIDSGRGNTFETQYVQKGKPAWANVSIQPFNDTTTGQNLAMVIVQDITDQVVYLKTLRESEEKYRLLVEGVEAAIAIIDYNGILRFINDYGASSHGLLREDVIGKSQHDLYPPEFAERQLANIRRVIETGEVFTEEAETIHQGKPDWLSTSIQPYHLFDSRERYVLVIAHSITARKKAEQNLRESQEHYRLLVESLEAAVAVFDYDGKMLFVNSRGAAPFDTTPEKLIGKTQWEIFPDDVANRQMESIRRVIDTGEGMTVEKETITGAGPVWYSTTLQAYRDSSGKPIAALVIAQNISERKLAEQALRESEQKFRTVAEQTLLGVLIYQDGLLKYVNEAAAQMCQRTRQEMKLWSPEQVMGTIHPDDRQQVIERAERRTRGEMIDPDAPVFYRIIRPDNTMIWTQQFARLIEYEGRPAILVTLVDITERRQAREALEKTKLELEQRVRERTVELTDANEMLKIERQSLQQKNIALQELIEQVQEGQRRMGDKILANVNMVVMPMVDALQNKVPDHLRQHITEIRRELSEITGEFVDTMQKKLTSLTPREIQICNLIKRGYSCKDIAGLLDNSVQTVLKQRAMIRKKLGISGQKVNLASYLRSITLQ